MKSDVVILIPIYKSQPTWNESLSFAQCIKVLGKRMISICTFEGLDIQYYTDTLDMAKVNFLTRSIFAVRMGIMNCI